MPVRRWRRSAFRRDTKKDPACWEVGLFLRGCECWLPGVDDGADGDREGGNVQLNTLLRACVLGVGDVAVELGEQTFGFADVPRSAFDEPDDALHTGDEAGLVGDGRSDLFVNSLVGVPDLVRDSAVVEVGHGVGCYKDVTSV